MDATENLVVRRVNGLRRGVPAYPLVFPLWHGAFLHACMGPFPERMTIGFNDHTEMCDED